MHAGNLIKDFVVRAVRQACFRGLPAAVENPIASILWSSPDMIALKSLPGFEEVCLDFCCFDTPWRKSTRLWSWNFPLSCVAKRCRAKAGVCSTSHKPHLVLSGRDPVSGQVFTKMAEPYPPQLCEDISKVVADLLERRRLLNLRRICMRPSARQG